MRRVTRRILWTGYWLLAGLLCLAAMLVLLLRLLLPQLESYTPELEKWLGDTLSADVQLESIQGSWQGPFPTLSINNLKIELPEQQLFQIQQARIGLNLGQSMLQGRPVFSQLKFTHPRIWLSLPGQTSAEAPVKKASEPPLVAFPLWVLDQPLSIEQGEVSIVLPGEQQVELKGLAASLVAVGNTYQMAIKGQLGAQEQYRPLQLVIEGQGAPGRGRVWLYGELNGLPPELVNPWLPEGLKLTSVNLKQQLWARIQRGELQQFQVKSDLRNLQFGEKWRLEESSLALSLRREGAAYQLQLHDSLLKLNKQRLELPDLALELANGPSGWRLSRGQIPSLALAPITEFASAQPLPEGVLDAVRGLNLRGTLENLDVRWSSADLSDFWLASDLHELALDDWDGVPQILGINGRLVASAGGGKIHLNSQDFTLNVADLFPEGWRYQQADGVVAWTVGEEAAVIHSELLHLKQDEIEARGRFSLRLPFDGSQTELTLMIGTDGADGRVTGRYVPPKEVGEDIHRWLVKAIKSGRVKQGGFLLNGGTRSRLDDYQLPVIQMFFDVRDAEFAYQPGWPAVTKGDAYLLFKDGDLSVDVTRGQILKSDIGRAWIELSPDRNRINVVGDLQGDARDIRTLLLDSPLREFVGDGLKPWRLTGAVHSDLNLSIPLDKGEPEVNVSSRIEKGTLSSKQYRLDFSAINGELHYRTPWGLQADELSAQVFDHTAKVKISSAPVKEFNNVARTQIQLDSRISIETLKGWLSLPMLNIADGETWYRARLNLCKTDQPGCTGLDLRSSLQGIEVVGPRDVEKARDEQRYFRLQSDLGDPQEQMVLQYGDNLEARLLMKSQRLERGRVAFNRKPVNLPAKPGLQVVGHLPSLDYDRLSIFLERSGLLSEDAEIGEKGKGAGGPPLHSIALSIGQFSLNDTVMTQLDTVLRPLSEGWNLSVSSKDLEGSILFPLSDAPYEVDIARLNLHRAEKAPENEAVEEALTPSPVDPGQLPRSNVRIRNLQLNDKPMGAWSFALMPDSTGVTIRNIEGQLQKINMQGELRWDAVQSHRSALTLKLLGGDLGDVLAAWGQERALENELLDAYLQLEWPGAPWQFGIRLAGGEARFIVKKGRIVESGGSSNFLRLFGILNLNALGRRLRLDFSDLFQKGVAFDRIGADYRLDNGIARTAKPFEMTGPSVDMKLSGQVDLVKETLDKQMEVTLPVTANLPVVGVLLGAAPQVAGAVFLIDKLIGDQLQQFTTIRYKLSGDWGDPQVALPKKPVDPNKKELPSGQQGDGK